MFLNSWKLIQRPYFQELHIFPRITSIASISSQAEMQTLSSPVLVDDYVAVAFEDHWYAGQVTAKRCNRLTVSFMSRASTGHNRFKWSSVPDVQEILEGNILCFLGPPIPQGTTRIVYIFNDSDKADEIFQRSSN